MPRDPSRLADLRRELDVLCPLWEATYGLFGSEPAYQGLGGDEARSQDGVGESWDVHLKFPHGVGFDLQEIAQRVKSLPGVANVFFVIAEKNGIS
jgi:hypothetical protein